MFTGDYPFGKRVRKIVYKSQSLYYVIIKEYIVFVIFERLDLFSVILAFRRFFESKNIATGDRK
jgi:ABC-type polysaccharide transport system permease subunit